jgi:hypothetical protein
VVLADDFEVHNRLGHGQSSPAGAGPVRRLQGREVSLLTGAPREIHWWPGVRPEWNEVLPGPQQVRHGCSTPVTCGPAKLPGRAGSYAGPARPIRWPSGSVKWPTTRPVGALTGPIWRFPPRLSARCSAASTLGTPT